MTTQNSSQFDRPTYQSIIVLCTLILTLLTSHQAGAGDFISSSVNRSAKVDYYMTDDVLIMRDPGSLHIDYQCTEFTSSYIDKGIWLAYGGGNHGGGNSGAWTDVGQHAQSWAKTAAGLFLNLSYPVQDLIKDYCDVNLFQDDKDDPADWGIVGEVELQQHCLAPGVPTNLEPEDGTPDNYYDATPDGLLHFVRVYRDFPVQVNCKTSLPENRCGFGDLFADCYATPDYEPEPPGDPNRGGFHITR